MSDGVRVFVAVARARRLRRITTSFAVFSLAENATWLAIIVYAYGRGGVSEAGVVSFTLLLPTAVIAPLAAYSGDRFRRDRVLAAGFAVQAASMAATAAAMAAAAMPVTVYACAAVAAISVSFTRPAVGAILPGLTDSPTDLTAANVMLGIANELGVFVGPLVAVVLYTAGSPTTVFAAASGGMTLSALAMLTLDVDPGRVQPSVRMDAGDVWTETLGGFAVLRRERDVRLLVLVLTSTAFAIGTSDVLYVAIADELLSGDSAGGAGLLNAAYGVGAIVGGVGSVILVGRRRLAPFALGGALAMSGALAALAGATAMATALALFLVVGAGKSLTAIASATMVQRVARSGVLARVFGVVEGTQMLAIGVGGIMVAGLVDMVGLRWAVLALGAVVLAPIATRSRRLLALDSRARALRPQVTALVRAEPIFNVLPPPALERLLAGIEEVHAVAGTVVVREGDVGDRFHLVESGMLDVTIGGEHVRRLGPGSSFGEIALIRDVPRTASVTAITDVALQSVGRDDFLEAVTGHPQSRARADEAAARLLGG